MKPQEVFCWLRFPLGEGSLGKFYANKNKQRGKVANSQLINFEEREKPP